MKHRRTQLERALSLPTGALSDGVRLEITDDRRVVIEGCRRVVEYGEDRICIDTACGRVRFIGRALCMTCLRSSGAVITGQLLAVEYL